MTGTSLGSHERRGFRRGCDANEHFSTPQVLQGFVKLRGYSDRCSEAGRLWE